MSARSISEYLRVLGAEATGSGPADADLVARFAATREEAAFELLVWRHAGMVQRVCRAALKDHHVAEDAAQATFLVLARKAGTFTARGSVVGWLYRVARRVSVRLARRRTHVTASSADLDRLPARAVAVPDEVEPLCAEVDRLPERYRVPVLLCFFEGLTHAEAARRTGWAIGTVASRLARAKELLARRLTSRGVTLGAIALPVAAGNFVGSTAQAAAALAAGISATPFVSEPVLSLVQGAMPTMTTTLLKWTAATAALMCVATAGVMGFSPAAGPGEQPPALPTQAAAAAEPQLPAAANQPPEPVLESVRRTQSTNNMKQILLAMHNYHDAYNQFPQNITDKNGKPLLSWRVAILPFIEQEPLYKQFKLNEPWDSDHNKKLAETVVKIYTTPGVKDAKPGRTFYKGFAGPGTAFEPGRKIKLTDIADGTSNTIGVIEAGPAVVWTKPEDIAYDPKQVFPTLEGPYKSAFVVGLMDGAVRLIKPELKAEEFRKLVEIADGNVVDFDAAKAIIKLDAKEEIAYLIKLQQVNVELVEKLAKLIVERERLVSQGRKNLKLTTADLEKIIEENKRLTRSLEQLTEEIKRLRATLPEKK